jgi:hypothetical protein
LMVATDEWTELREVLEGHCEAVGRDAAEIDCSVHVLYKQDAELAETAARHHANGVDIVLFTMGEPQRPVDGRGFGRRA